MAYRRRRRRRGSYRKRRMGRRMRPLRIGYRM